MDRVLVALEVRSGEDNRISFANKSHLPCDSLHLVRQAFQVGSYELGLRIAGDVEQVGAFRYSLNASIPAYANYELSLSMRPHYRTSVNLERLRKHERCPVSQQIRRTNPLVKAPNNKGSRR